MSEAFSKAYSVFNKLSLRVRLGVYRFVASRSEDDSIWLAKLLAIVE